MDSRKTKTDQGIFDDYINNLEKPQKRQHNISNIDAFLLSKGLYRLIECDAHTKGSVYDPTDKKTWRKVPITITQQQYGRLCEIDSRLNKNSPPKSNALKKEAYFIAIFGAIVYLSSVLLPEMRFSFGFVALLIAGALYLFFRAVGNVVSTLDDIRNVLKDKLK